ERRGARLVVVAPHHPYHVRSVVGEVAGFTVLVDPALTASATYGSAFGTYQREWTNEPATFVIDREGVIRFAHRRGRMSRDYAPPEQLLHVVDGLREKRLLIEALKGKSARAHRAAVLALAPIGAEARKAVPDLFEALNDEDADVRAGALAAL